MVAASSLPPSSRPPARRPAEMRRAAAAEAADSLLRQTNITTELIVQITQPDPGRLSLQSHVLQVEDVSLDIGYAGVQFGALQKNDLPVLAAQFTLAKTEEIESEPILVPLAIPNLESVRESYNQIQEATARMGLSVFRLSISDAVQALRKGLIEFLDVRLIATMATNGSNSPVPTVVDTNRAGDQVLYAKGYFASTQQGFGRSTPARSHLLPGRYGFGIMDGQNPRFDPVLWSVPYHGNIWLPLP